MQDDPAGSLVPATQAVCDQHLVLQGARSLNGGHIADREVELTGSLVDVGSDP